jgi:hypothetical protein
MLHEVPINRLNVYGESVSPGGHKKVNFDELPASNNDTTSPAEVIIAQDKLQELTSDVSLLALCPPFGNILDVLASFIICKVLSPK